MKFDHVHIKCMDLEKAVDFYVKIFGARVFARQMSAGVPMVRIDLGGTMFNLSAVGTDENLPEPKKRDKVYPSRGLSHVGVVVDDLDKTVREMRAKGAEVIVEPKQAFPGTRVAFIKGPEEDAIEIVSREKPLVF